MAAQKSEAIVLPPGEGRAIDLGNFAMTLKADEESTGGGLSLLEASEPAEFGPPMHIHHNAAEAFYVLEGVYIVFIGTDHYECPAGSFILIPAGIEHGFRVSGVASRKLNMYTPAAMVGYFDELAAAIRSGDMAEEKLTEIALTYGMEVTGPVPEGYV